MTIEQLVTFVLVGGVLTTFVAWWTARNRYSIDPIDALQREVILTRAQVAKIGAEAHRNLIAAKPPAPALPERPMHVLVPGPAAEDNPCPHDEVIETRSLCDANPTCMCALCGANLPHLED